MADFYSQFSIQVPYDGPEYDWICTTLNEGWSEDEPYEFEWDFLEKNGKYYLHIFGKGDPSHVCDFLHFFIESWHPDRYYSFSWANVCSAYRPDAFYGGEAFITSKGVAYHEPAIWRLEQLNRFNPVVPEGWAPPQVAPHIVVVNESDYA